MANWFCSLVRIDLGLSPNFRAMRSRFGRTDGTLFLKWLVRGSRASAKAPGQHLTATGCITPATAGVMHPVPLSGRAAPGGPESRPVVGPAGTHRLGRVDA